MHTQRLLRCRRSPHDSQLAPSSPCSLSLLRTSMRLAFKMCGRMRLCPLGRRPRYDRVPAAATVPQSYSTRRDALAQLLVQPQSRPLRTRVEESPVQCGGPQHDTATPAQRAGRNGTPSEQSQVCRTSRPVRQSGSQRMSSLSGLVGLSSSDEHVLSHPHSFNQATVQTLRTQAQSICSRPNTYPSGHTLSIHVDEHTQ